MNSTITLPRSVVEQALEALDEIAWSNNTRRQSDRADDARIVLRAALEQAQVNSPEIPEGWKLVPVEPTSEMLDAGRNACEGRFYPQDMLHGPRAMMADSWAAMLDAAPQPPVVEQPQVEQEPVAYYVMNGAALFQLFRSKSQADALAYDLQKRHDLSGSLAHFHVVPLYIRPQPPRQPLTDEAERQCPYPKANPSTRDAWLDGWEAAEREHGIGGEA